MLKWKIRANEQSTCLAQKNLESFKIFMQYIERKTLIPVNERLLRPPVVFVYFCVHLYLYINTYMSL